MTVQFKIKDRSGAADFLVAYALTESNAAAA